jgi:hypothetical protein
MGLGSCVVAGVSVAMFLVACGDDDNGTLTGVDSGLNDANTTPTDGGDGGGGNPTVDSGQVAKVQLVNAAQDFGPTNASGGLRVCYSLAAAGQPSTASQAPLPPLPDTTTPGTPFPGVFIGTGGSIPGTGADLSGVDVTPYLMNAQSLAVRGLVKSSAAGQVETSCKDLFDAANGGSGTYGSGANDAGNLGPLQANVDYWKLPVIPAGTLKRDHSYILVLTGCTGDSASAGVHCGPGWTASGPGNLKTNVVDLDNATAVDAAKLGAQFFHASTASEDNGTLEDGGVQHPGLIVGGTFNALNGGTAVPLFGLTPTLTQVSGVNPASDSFTVNKDVSLFTISLQQVRALTYGNPPPAGTDFTNGKAYTFIGLGDPATSVVQTDGGINGRGYHYLALPNDPVIPSFTP